MPQSLSEKPIIALGDWLETPAGSYVRAWEQARLDTLTADIFGFNALQIGLPQVDALRANRMPNKWLSDTRCRQGTESARSPVVVVHDFAELPFASQSLDLVVLPHVLEFADEPHQVLREVERVLIPEGQVIVCGFNPASLWGARQLCGRLSGAPFLPRHAEFISMPRIKDWMKLLNLGVNRGYFGCYAPPMASRKVARTLCLHGIGRRTLVAVSGRGVHGAGDQAGQGHAPDRPGLEQARGANAARYAGNQ